MRKFYASLLLIVTLLTTTMFPAAKAVEEEDHKAIPIGIHEHNIAPIIIPVIKNERVIAYLRLVIKLVTNTGSEFKPYEVYLPRIVDAIFSDLYVALSDQWLPYKDPAEDTIAKRVQNMVDTIMGKDILTSYITSFYFNRSKSEPPK